MAQTRQERNSPWQIKRTFVLVLPVLLLLACQLTSILPGTVSLAETPTLTAIQPSATQTQPPSATLTPTSSPTATAPPPTATPTQSPTATTPAATATLTPTSLPTDLQLEIFTELWEIVRDEYLYPDFNGLDWDATRSHYETAIQAGMDNQSFYSAMDTMVESLGDEHSVFLRPEIVAREDLEYEGNYNYAGIGILLRAVPERGRAVVLAVFPDSPASRAGLLSRDSILAANGIPILSETGSIRSIIRGPEGSEVTITVQSPQQAPRQLVLVRQQISSAIPVESSIFTTESGKRIGYILLVTFADSTIDESVAQALREMSAETPLDGLIIDNRPNGGGADTVVRPILSYLTSGTIGYFVSRDQDRPLTIREPQDINGSQAVPLVVLVGLDTGSFGEIFSGVLQDTHRAYLIGETTGGNVETLWGYNFKDGSRAWIAHESFRPLNNPQADWEADGIIPDEEVFANWEEHTLDTDPVIQAALAHLDR